MKKSVFYGILFVYVLGGISPTVLLAQSKAKEPSNKTAKSISIQESPGAAVYKKNVESIVLIEAEDSSGKRQGSGVAITLMYAGPSAGDYKATNTWIVTNAHVVKAAPFVNVMVAGYPAKGTVRYRDPQMDIALIFLPTSVIPAISLNSPVLHPSPGDSVFAIGAPKGLTRSITEGLVSANRTIDGVKLIQTSAAISPGSSGGGLFSQSGNLIGITTFKVVGGESLNFAVDIDQAASSMRALNAADMIKQLIDEKHHEQFGDAFVKWILTTSGANGSTVLDEYNKIFTTWMVSRDTETRDKLLFELASQYYLATQAPKALGDSGAKASGDSGEKSKTSGQIVVLICKLYDEQGKQETRTYKMDFDGSTVNGFPASVNSEYVRYSTNRNGAEFRYVFDRNAATLTVSTEGFPKFRHGGCSKSEGRVF